MVVSRLYDVREGYLRLDMNSDVSSHIKLLIDYKHFKHEGLS